MAFNSSLNKSVLGDAVAIKGRRFITIVRQ